MKRRLLLGRAGSGKTRICLDRLVDALRKGLKALLVVPTYSQAEHLRTRLLDRISGLGARAVETFSSLAERVARQPLRDLVPPPVRDRVAQEVLAEFFPAASDQAGFRAEFLSAVKEIKEQGVEPLDAIVSARAYFSSKSRGRLLFEAYARYVERLPGPDHEDLLLRLRGELKLDLELLLVDGFHDFTPLEKQIVDRMADCARETLVTLPLGFDTAARTAATFEGYGRRELGGSFREPQRRELIACASEEDEADRLARLVAASERPYGDFLLVRRSFDGLHALYRAAFDRYGLPLRFFGTEPLGHLPVAGAAALWLRHLAGEVPPLDLLALLRSPYFLPAPPVSEVDGLARDLRRTGTAELPLERPEGALGDLLPRHIGLERALIALPDGDIGLARAARFLDALRKEADAVRDLPLAEAAQAVLRRIPLLRGAWRDRRHDAVYAVDALGARQWEKPCVMVAGLTADAFPHPIRQDLFLRDEERRDFARQGGLALPARSLREDEERYLFHVAMTRATERLVLTHAAFDEEGTPRPPSPFLADALRDMGEVQRREISLSEQHIQPRDALRRSDLLPIVADGLVHGHPLAAALYESGAVPRAELAWPRRLALLRTRPIPAMPAVVSLSATSISSFNRCPFLFLMRKVLKVQPARERALDALLKGTLVHRALERFARERGDPGAIFDELFAEETAGYRIGLDEEAARRWMRQAVLRAAEEMLSQPVHESERKFELDVGGVTLLGRIDRIDRYPAGDLIRDYKTGSSTRDDGVQLNAYLLAVRNPAGAVYERLRHGDRAGFVLAEIEGAAPGKLVEVVDRAGIEERRDAVRAQVARVAGEVRAGNLAVRPSEPERCRRGKCDGYDLCRVARARWLARAAR